MKKIANIVSQTELINHTKQDWINYYVFGNQLDIDFQLPTLIVGWNIYKKHFPELKPNILSKEIRKEYPRVGWEFSMDEKITDHYSGIEKFIKSAPREYVNSYTYLSIDPMINGISNTDDLIDALQKVIRLEKSIMYQYKDEIIYILDENNENTDNEKIVGVYLNSYRYFGLNVSEIESTIGSKVVKKYLDPDGLIYQSFYKIFPEFDQLKRTMVLFLA